MKKIESIVHISDIHFRMFQRHDEYRSICEHFISKMKEFKPDRIVITGDAVHSRNNLTPELVDEVQWFLRELSQYTEKCIIIPGNHDIVEQNKSRMDAIVPILKTLNIDNIVYYKHSGLYKDENVIWTVFSIYDDNMAPDNLKTKPYDGIYIGLYHGIINGASNNLGYVFNYGAELNKFNGCDLALCGDIHKRQVFYTNNGAPIIMVGSFIQQNFSETISEHGYNIVSLKDNNKVDFKFYDIENPVKYMNFEIGDFEDILGGNEILTNL